MLSGATLTAKLKCINKNTVDGFVFRKMGDEKAHLATCLLEEIKNAKSLMRGKDLFKGVTQTTLNIRADICHETGYDGMVAKPPTVVNCTGSTPSTIYKLQLLVLYWTVD